MRSVSGTSSTAPSTSSHPKSNVQTKVRVAYSLSMFFWFVFETSGKLILICKEYLVFKNCACIFY